MLPSWALQRQIALISQGSVLHWFSHRFRFKAGLPQCPRAVDQPRHASARRSVEAEQCRC